MDQKVSVPPGGNYLQCLSILPNELFRWSKTGVPSEVVSNQKRALFFGGRRLFLGGVIADIVLGIFRCSGSGKIPFYRLNLGGRRLFLGGFSRIPFFSNRSQQEILYMPYPQGKFAGLSNFA